MIIRKGNNTLQGQQHQTPLNSYGQPVGSPIDNLQGTVGGQTGYQFAHAHQRSSVDLSRIKNFSFNQGYGGTLTLGGLTNGNGELIVKNTGGTTVVQLDNNGLTINYGAITMKNQGNTTIIDTSGLVSIANFPNGGFSSNTQQTTTSLTPVDVTGSNGTLVLSRTANVLTIATGFGYNVGMAGNTGYKMNFQLVDSIHGTLGNVAIGGQWIVTSINGTANSYTLNVSDQAITFEFLGQLEAGTHTTKLQYNAINGGTATLDNYEWLYVVLGV